MNQMHSSCVSWFLLSSSSNGLPAHLSMCSCDACTYHEMLEWWVCLLNV
jgi:hypothetical protein